MQRSEQDAAKIFSHLPVLVIYNFPNPIKLKLRLQIDWRLLIANQLVQSNYLPSPIGGVRLCCAFYQSKSAGPTSFCCTSAVALSYQVLYILTTCMFGFSRPVPIPVPVSYYLLNIINFGIPTTSALVQMHIGQQQLVVHNFTIISHMFMTYCFRIRIWVVS